MKEGSWELEGHLLLFLSTVVSFCKRVFTVRKDSFQKSSDH